MYQVIYDKLEKVEENLPISRHEAAWRMISGRFQRLKCAFGTDATATPWLKLDVPSLGFYANFPEANIENGQMLIEW